MKGVSLEYTKTFRYVINMDLSSNKLVGVIPVELMSLSALVGLNLSNNHLNGGIPDSIRKMKALISLDFSGNQLTGFWGVIGVLLFKKHWRHKLFMFAEETVDKIYVAAVIRFNKMKRGREAT
nr:leucine-rich repeat protein [Tanacetum cinerariifolium]